MQAAIAAAQDGDVGALHFLYVRYADVVFGYLRSLLGRDDAADEVMADLFARLIPAVESYDIEERPFVAWLLRRAKSAAVEYERACRRTPWENVGVLRLPEAPAPFGVNALAPGRSRC